MTTEQDIRDKWGELLDYAKQHATGEGMHTGYRWVEDNREVLAGRICLELGNHIGGRHLIDEAQEAKLKATLQHIVEHPSQSMGVRR